MVLARTADREATEWFNIVAWGNLANNLARQGRYDEAERVFARALARKAAESFPGHPDVVRLKGELK